MLVRFLDFSRRHRLLATLMGLGAIGLVALGVLLTVATIWPSIAAENIDKLRDIIGDQPVAALETFVFNVQDGFQHWGAQTGVVQSSAPWVENAPIIETLPTSQPALVAPVTATPPPNATLPPIDAHSPTAVPTWQPAPLVSLGALPGEGQWSAYLQNPAGQTVAYRTFLQPDPQRPYAIAAIVAFNLQATRMHFVLGSIEPKSDVPIIRPGTIPASDLQPGVLLATFNGGFKARHGHYGVMVDGVVVLPPLPKIGTVALYSDSRVRIGAWGTDITASPDIVTWRQNGPLIVDRGQINPETSNDDSKVWGGYVLSNLTPSWRSALAISADGQTLYYIAGPGLDLPVLAKTVVDTNATEAIQLDVNNFWVHFAAIQTEGTTLTALPLVKGMTEKPDRYLKSYPRDFFYITAAPAANSNQPLSEQTNLTVPAGQLK